MTKPKAAPPPDLGRELGAVLDRIDRERAALAELVKERKGRIANLESRAHKLRDLLAGRDLDQVEMPGTGVTEMLDAAGRVADRKGAADGRGT